MNKFRSHNCNELKKNDIGSEVILSGWINKKRDHGNLLFIDLRDNYGITQCIIDKGNNFVCSDINLFEECVGGSAICKPGYVYNNRRCLMNHGTEYDENGRIICREGFIHDRLGNCIFGKIRNGRPTNYILNEDYELSCKDGYKLENGLCKIKDNWTCQRGNSVRGGDDGIFCYDPHEINNVISCRSKPICPEKTRIVQNGECMLFSEVRDKDCIGKWEECDNTCEDSKFTIIQNKSGFGDECRDDEGNILGEGSTRSCLGEYHCNTSNRLCGTNRNNIIIDDFIIYKFVYFYSTFNDCIAGWRKARLIKI